MRRANVWGIITPGRYDRVVLVFLCLQVLNPQKLKSLEQWLQETNTTLTQINGQRKYGAPPPGTCETTH